MRSPLNSPGHTQRDSGAHQSILASVKELSRLLHLPKELLDNLENARHRDAYKQMMVQKEAIATALQEIVCGVKTARKPGKHASEDVEELKAENEAFRDRIAFLERELASALSDLPVDFPGRVALLKAGVTTQAAVQALTTEELLGIPGIGHVVLDKIYQYGGGA